MSTHPSGSAPKPHEHIVCTAFETGEGVLVDLDTKKYFQLNETALLVWECLEKGQSYEEIVTKMTSLYEVSPDQAARSLERLLNNLRAYKLIPARQD